MEIIFYFIFSQIHSFTEVVQKVQISNVDLDTHTEVCLRNLQSWSLDKMPTGVAVI